MIHYQKVFTTAKSVVVAVGLRQNGHEMMVMDNAGLSPLEVFREIAKLEHYINERGYLL